MADPVTGEGSNEIISSAGHYDLPHDGVPALSYQTGLPFCADVYFLLAAMTPSRYGRFE
jgi:hypothetical protein